MTTSPRLSAPAAPVPARPSPARHSPTREIGVFLGTVAVLLTGTTVFAASQDADVQHVDQAPPLVQAVLFGQALIPLVAAVVAGLVTRGSLRRPGWGFRRTSPRSLGRAWLWALGTTLTGGVLVWLTGTGSLDGDGLDAMVPLGLTVLVAPYVLLALAEDVGWRGLLVTRLAEVSGPRTVVLGSGLAWAAFHAPLVVVLGGTPDGVPVAWALACFTVGAVAFGAVLASMQLRWGIWPGVLAHAVVNAAMYHVLDPLTGDTGSTGWFAGETGLFQASVMVVAAVVWFRFAPLRRSAAGGTEPAAR